LWRDKVLVLEINEFPVTLSGQTEKNLSLSKSLPDYPESGHRSIPSACLKNANNGTKACPACASAKTNFSTDVYGGSLMGLKH
jgi:hypothetical protein